MQEGDWTKYIVEENIQKFKAHLVAKGYSQQLGVDFDGVFAPVVRIETMTMLLALVVQLKWEVFHFDVKSNFLNGEIHEEDFMEQPKGYIIKVNENKVYKLTMALYGLKNAHREWYTRIDNHFQMKGDKCNIEHIFILFRTLN